jgi:hypothetical protein
MGSTGETLPSPICKHIRYIHTHTRVRTYVHVLQAYVHTHKIIPIQKRTGLTVPVR